jgi:hypothetical protein
MKSKFLATLALIFLVPLIGVMAGCGSVKPKTPAQAVYVAESEFNLAIQAAVNYKNLPPCGVPGVGVVCSNPDVVKKLQDAEKKASAAFAQAEQVALAPNASQSDVDKALAIANAALAVLTQLEAQLKTK